MPRVKPQVARAREQEAWEFRAKGWTHSRIAERMGLTRQAIGVILARSADAEHAEMLANQDRVKATQTATLEYLVNEAMDAWERSQLDAETKKTTEEEVKLEGATIRGSQTKTERWSKGQSGDPRFLAEARQALASIREIWGVDAPKKSDVTSAGQPMPAPLQFVEVVRPALPAPDPPRDPDPS